MTDRSISSAILAITYTFRYVSETSHFVKNLFFGHNEHRFHAEFHGRVKSESTFIHDSKSTFHSEYSGRSNMKNRINSIQNEL